LQNPLTTLGLSPLFPQEETISHTQWQDADRKNKTRMKELSAAIPDVMKRFSALGKAAISDGTLNARTKELRAGAGRGFAL
jgi:alkylhydroperoxidase/carboxymuconolactone decarboxylase family protein YurZ